MNIRQFLNRMQNLSFYKIIKYLKVQEINQLLYESNGSLHVCNEQNIWQDNDYNIKLYSNSNQSGIVSVDERITLYRSVYILRQKEKIVHESWVYFDPVLPAQFEFDKNIPLIGDCKTIPEYRGKGIYPLVLCYIANDLQKKNISTKAYVLVSPDNKALIRGIEKANFHFMGHLTAKRIFGLYTNKLKTMERPK